MTSCSRSRTIKERFASSLDSYRLNDWLICGDTDPSLLSINCMAIPLVDSYRGDINQPSVRVTIQLVDSLRGDTRPNLLSTNRINIHLIDR